MKKQLWKNILQFIVTIATSIISAIGVTSCVGTGGTVCGVARALKKHNPDI